LWNDTSLYCVSAHNDLSSVHTAYDTSRALRTASYPNYGWYAKVDFLSELQDMLLYNASYFDWDMAAFMTIRKDRECIIPEVGDWLIILVMYLEV